MLRPEVCNFIKKILQRSCFPVNIGKFTRTAFLQNTSGGCFRGCLPDALQQLLPQSMPPRSTYQHNSYVWFKIIQVMWSCKTWQQNGENILDMHQRKQINGDQLKRIVLMGLFNLCYQLRKICSGQNNNITKDLKTFKWEGSRFFRFLRILLHFCCCCCCCCFCSQFNIFTIFSRFTLTMKCKECKDGKSLTAGLKC